MSKKIIVLLNGDIQPTASLRCAVVGGYVIAADGGIAHCKALNVKPDIWIGDFDSSDDDVSQIYANVQRLSHSSDKDISDGALAIEHAIGLEPERIIICGAMGGPRTDHAVFNLVSILHYAQQNEHINFALLSGNESAFPLHKGTDNKIAIETGCVFSVLPLSALTSLDVLGAKWPLKNQNVPMGSTLTLSNIAQDDLIIRLKDGNAIVVVQNKLN